MRLIGFILIGFIALSIIAIAQTDSYLGNNFWNSPNNITTEENITAGSNLEVLRNGTIHGNLSILGSHYTTQNVTIGGNVTITSFLTMGRSMTIDDIILITDPLGYVHAPSGVRTALDRYFFCLIAFCYDDIGGALVTGMNFNSTTNPDSLETWIIGSKVLAVQSTGDLWLPNGLINTTNGAYFHGDLDMISNDILDVRNINVTNVTSGELMGIYIQAPNSCISGCDTMDDFPNSYNWACERGFYANLTNTTCANTNGNRTCMCRSG